MEASASKELPLEPAPQTDPRIHKWATRLVRKLQGAGVRTSDAVLTTSKYGYRSAYFAVPGIGEVRVSDHPLNDAHPTSDVSISRPASFIDLARAYVYVHNKSQPRKLSVLEDDPFIMEASEAVTEIARMEAEKASKLAAFEAYKKIEVARRAFWDDQIARSGLEGDHKDVKFQLRMQGVRCPPEFASTGEVL
jgi:hypothetical protein